MKNTVKILLATASVSLLTACGGGGGGGGGATASSNENGSIQNDSDVFRLVTPIKLSSVPRIGTPTFPTTVTDYGTGTVSFAQSSSSGGFGRADSAIYGAATSNRFQVYPTTHITNEVVQAWADGWTGFGITLSVIDDFQNITSEEVITTPVIRRSATYTSSFWGQVGGLYDNIYQWIVTSTHGANVSNIAGGDFDGAQNVVNGVAVSMRSAANASCATIVAGPGGFTFDCESGFYINTFPAFRDSVQWSFKKVAGVAKQALVVENSVNLSSRQNPIQTVADIQGHLKNSAYLGVINLSLGSDIPTSGRTFTEVMEQVSRFPLQRVDAVITVAAGNGGAACAAANLNGCNSVAVALAFQQATSASTIVVGATRGVGLNENIATYSTRAGILAERFVLASGEEGSEGIFGTSFAAPRVAGIASILRQKYPSLTSAQIANVILLSASKDINNDGVDDFTGVSPIFGHGKASLTRALALAGSI